MCLLSFVYSSDNLQKKLLLFLVVLDRVVTLNELTSLLGCHLSAFLSACLLRFNYDPIYIY
jgi:hypothetical protein